MTPSEARLELTRFAVAGATRYRPRPVRHSELGEDSLDKLFGEEDQNVLFGGRRRGDVLGEPGSDEAGAGSEADDVSGRRVVLETVYCEALTNRRRECWLKT